MLQARVHSAEAELGPWGQRLGIKEGSGRVLQKARLGFRQDWRQDSSHPEQNENADPLGKTY